VAALGFFGVLLYVLRDGLSPLLAATALLCLLVLARRGVPFETGLAVVSVLLFGAWFVSELAGMLWPFALSFIFAYLVAPLVGILSRRISRTLAIFLIVLLVLGAMAGIGAVVIPRITAEVTELGDQLPKYGTEIRKAYDRLVAWVGRYGFSLSREEIQRWFVEQLPAFGEIAGTRLKSALLGLTSGLASLLNLLMIPFVTFYVLLDYERIKQALRSLLPRRYVEPMGELVGRVDEVLGQYVRGQLLVCAFIAALTSLGLAVSGIRYAVILGIMAGLSNLVPYVGLAVSLGITSLVVLLDAAPFYDLIKVVVVFVVVQSIEGNFLSPRVVGQRVGLHPAWVMFALVASAHFWGFVGMLVAIPLAAVVNIVVRIVAERYFSSRYYSHVSE